MFQDNSFSPVQAIGVECKYCAVLLIRKIVYSRRSLSEGRSFFRSCVDHVHSFNTNVTGLPEFDLVLFETTEQAVRTPAGILTTLVQVSRRFHWSVRETSGMLLQLVHVTLLPVPS